ncbi:MAG: M48 family metallopeptidase [Cytophagales bacterium]|nr:M48 family metallopeptidase [Rhizobacter sp.]
MTTLPSPFRCSCSFHSRRLFTTALLGSGGLLALPALAREGVEVGKQSVFTQAISAQQVEAMAQQNYVAMKQQASAKNALAKDDHPQVIRLRSIAKRLIPFTYEWNPRAREWKWEVSLIGSDQINAFCMPGGKIAFFVGILQKLQLTDDEVAMIMGHEMAHALREHARERMGKNMATRGAIEIGAALFGLGNGARLAADMTGQLLSLKFGREDESEADLVGMELAARGGYDPRAGVSLWNKMAAAAKGAPPQFLSTHPSGPTRIQDIQASLPKVAGLYARAPKPEQRFEPPRAASAAAKG